MGDFMENYNILLAIAGETTTRKPSKPPTSEGGWEYRIHYSYGVDFYITIMYDPSELLIKIGKRDFNKYQFREETVLLADPNAIQKLRRFYKEFLKEGGTSICSLTQ